MVILSNYRLNPTIFISIKTCNFLLNTEIYFSTTFKISCSSGKLTWSEKEDKIIPNFLPLGGMHYSLISESNKHLFILTT